MQNGQIANELKALATNGTRVPGFRGKVMVEIDSLMMLSNALGNVTMPDELREASEVLKMKESILNQAYLEAKRIRSSAEEEASTVTTKAHQDYASKVDDSEVLRRAEEISKEMQEEAGYESQQILQDAQRKAYRIMNEAENAAMARRDGADSYAREVLFNLEEQLADVLGQVRRGIDALNIEVEASKRKQGQNGNGNGNGVAAEAAVNGAGAANGVAVV